ncbi:3-prime end of extracellular mutant protein [Metschnikowia bicuspidata]|uniref:3-prime end of extracellular mutant protein n=1 Tax=Metschnikowia bicuspidata TaxID=27322 RepID=A0A4P9ZDE3_9ASCO|nr:3-prime end of extracellular mutant protein [Metschnikowia bicuspidata]
MQWKYFTVVAATFGAAAAAAVDNATLITATPTVALSCSFSSFTATAPSQLKTIAACPTAVGDITISGDGFGNIDITGTKRIYGKLTVNGTQKATMFNAPTLELVSDELRISFATILATVNLALLTTVHSLYYNALPALQQAGLSTGLTSAESITFANTGLNSLDGVNVQTLKTFDVNNNQDIQFINSTLQSVTDSLSINYNSAKVVVDLDSLTSVKDLSFQSVGFFSAQKLTSINGSLTIDSNSFRKFKFQELTRIGDSLWIGKNDNLYEFDLEKLSYIGGALNIIDNHSFRDFSFFPKLATVGGSVNIVGAFDKGTLPSLEKVAGGFNMTSTGELSCASFVNLNNKGGVKGNEFYCQGASYTISSSSSKPGNNANGQSIDTSAASASSIRRTGAAARQTVSKFTFAAFFASVGAILY